MLLVRASLRAEVQARIWCSLAMSLPPPTYRYKHGFGFVNDSFSYSLFIDFPFIIARKWANSYDHSSRSVQWRNKKSSMHNPEEAEVELDS